MRDNEQAGQAGRQGRQVIRQHYAQIPLALYHCTGCGYLHTWDYDGDCPASARRYRSPAHYRALHDTRGYRVYVVSQVGSWVRRYIGTSARTYLAPTRITRN